MLIHLDCSTNCTPEFWTSVSCLSVSCLNSSSVFLMALSRSWICKGDDFQGRGVACKGCCERERPLSGATMWGARVGLPVAVLMQSGGRLHVEVGKRWGTVLCHGGCRESACRAQTLRRCRMQWCGWGAGWRRMLGCCCRFLWFKAA